MFSYRGPRMLFDVFTRNKAAIDSVSIQSNFGCHCIGSFLQAR